MPATDSRQGPGTLTLGTLTGAGCQMSNVRLVPEAEEEDGLPVLCDPDPAPSLTTNWSLQGTAVQDWELSADTGFVEFCRVNDGLTVAFTWVPNTDIGVEYSGSCQVRAVEIGGDVAVQTTTDFEFPVVGELTRVDAVAAA
jgi:hypothetical protein